MSRNKTKLCLGCQRLFEGRRDAKTCSPRCRKRFQRAKNLYYETRPIEWQRQPVNFKKDIHPLEGRDG